MDFLIDNRYDCLPLAPRIYVHPPRLTPFQLLRVTGRLLLFPDSLLNQTWWYVQRGQSHKHLSLLHRRVPNPGIDSCWCSLVTVTDLCSAFFPLLIPDSPFLSAVMFRGRQLTWTHVSQGWCEIIFPSLQSWLHFAAFTPNSTVAQYMCAFLLCNQISRVMKQTLSFFQAPSSRGSSWPRDQAHIPFISCIGSRILYHCTTWEVQGTNETRPERFHI